MPDAQEGMQVDREGGVIVRKIEQIPIDIEHIERTQNFSFRVLTEALVNLLTAIADFRIDRGLVLKSSYATLGSIFNGILFQAISICESIGIEGDLNQGIIRIINTYAQAVHPEFIFLPLTIGDDSMFGMAIYNNRGFFSLTYTSILIPENDACSLITGVVMNGATLQAE